MRPKRPPEGVERPDPPPPPPSLPGSGLSEEQLQALTKGVGDALVKKIIARCADEAQREIEKSEGRIFILERAVVEAAVSWYRGGPASEEGPHEGIFWRAVEALVTAKEGR